MDKARVLIVSLLLLQCACFTRQARQEEIRPGFICGIEGFTLSSIEHIVDEINQKILVRTVEGKIISEGGPWPKECQILFEIRKTHGPTETIEGYADNEGNFEIPEVPEGTYCFKVTVEGWRSVMGIITVDKKAPKNSIRIVMRMGV